MRLYTGLLVRLPVLVDGRQPETRSEVSCLSKRLPTGGVSDGEGVSSGGMSCAVGRHLGIKQVAARIQGLSRRQTELIGDHRGGAAVALRDLSAHGVVLPVEAHPTGVLNVDGD